VPIGVVYPEINQPAFDYYGLARQKVRISGAISLQSDIQIIQII
jgi:hypothetical protein